MAIQNYQKLENYYSATGYYLVGDSIYSSKLQALIDGTARNIHPEWVFHQNIFNNVNWTQSSTKSIIELYYNRAREIREKYDYVCILYSGGIDSQNILESFLNQGLRVDELVTTWSVQAAEKYAGSINNRSPGNYIAEWTYCIQPYLKLISEQHPEIKITVDDSTVHVAKNIYQETDFFMFDHYHNLPGLNRWPPVIKKLEIMNEQHPNSVTLIGVDKPQLFYNGTQLYLWFIDVTTHIKSTERLNAEYFYWSPECVELLQKQCHLIFNFFQQNPQLRNMLYKRDDALLQIINLCIYPTYNPEIFQANKNFLNIFNEQQQWAWKMSQYNDGTYVDRWIGDWRNFLLVIDEKYKKYTNHLFDGFVGFVTPKYLIGEFR